MTIKQAIDSGVLPNIEESKYLEICASLGIDATDLNYELQEGELNKLKYNSEVNIYYATDRVQKAHNKLLDNYNKLIEKYKKISEEMTEDYLADDKVQIDELIGKLEEARNGYDSQIQNIDLSSKNMNMDKKVLNNFQEKRLNSLSNREEKVDEKLQAEYETLKDLQSVKFSSKFKQRRNEKEIKRVQDRIKRLQKKQGRLQNTQQRIINRGTEKYKKIKDRELRTIVNELEETSTLANNYKENKEMQAGYENDMELNSKMIEDFSSKKGLFNKFKLERLKRDQKKMERRLKSLKNKEEAMEYLRTSNKDLKCNDLGSQFIKTVVREYAYSM